MDEEVVITFEECLTAAQQDSAQKSRVAETRRHLKQETQHGISPWEVDCAACFMEVPEDESGTIDSFVPDGVAF